MACESEIPRVKKMAVFILREGRLEFIVAYDPRESEVHVGMAALRAKWDGKKLERSDGGRPLDVFEGAILEKVASRLSLDVTEPQVLPAPAVLMDPHVHMCFMDASEDPSEIPKKISNEKLRWELIPLDGNREVYDEVLLRHVPQYHEAMGVQCSVTDRDDCMFEIVHRRVRGGFEIQKIRMRLLRQVCAVHDPKPETLS